MGSTGAGKTSYFLNLIKSEINNALIVLDPNGDLAGKAAALAPADRLIYVDKNNPISLNPLTRKYLNRPEIANELVEVINTAVSAVSPEQVAITVLMAKIIRNSIRIFKDGQLDIEYLGNFLEYEEERKKVPDRYWQDFDKRDNKGWYVNREQVESAKRVSARLSLFYEDENLKPFIKGENQFDIPDLIKEKKIVCFNLYGFDDQLTAFIGCLVSNQIKSYYLHQATNNSSPLYFYCDEYHLFITHLFSRFLAEARKYNISCNFAGHSFSQINKSLASMVLSNSFIKVVFSCGAEDAQLVAKEIGINPHDILELKSYEAYIGIGKKSHKVLTFPPPETEPYQPEEALAKRACNFLRNAWIPPIQVL